jgi:hypothetical protein
MISMIASSYKNEFVILTFNCLFSVNLLTDFMNPARTDPDLTRKDLVIGTESLYCRTMPLDLQIKMQHHRQTDTPARVAPGQCIV